MSMALTLTKYLCGRTIKARLAGVTGYRPTRVTGFPLGNRKVL